jgi:RNA polymerase sigma factor (TIGR02999 family)
MNWDGRGHFFAAAAEAMRRILVDNARRRLAIKRGGDRRADVDLDQLAGTPGDQDVLDVHEALDRLALEQPKIATLVKLRYFAGFTIPEAAAVMGVAPRTLDAWWAYARAWLASALRE